MSQSSSQVGGPSQRTIRRRLRRQRPQQQLQRLVCDNDGVSACDNDDDDDDVCLISSLSSLIAYHHSQKVDCPRSQDVFVKAFHRNRSCASEHDQHDDIYDYAFCGSCGGPCRCKSDALDGGDSYSSDSETDESETTLKTGLAARGPRTKLVGFRKLAGFWTS